MQHDLSRNAVLKIRQNRRRRIWQKVVQGMACVVVFCTTYALILPAITMEKQTFCGFEEHTHSAECYIPSEVLPDALICTPASLGVHTHSDACIDMSGNVVCGQADYFAHSHTDVCFDSTGEMRCSIPEATSHEHGDACYEVAETQPDPDVHVHSEACYMEQQGELTCEIAEDEEHRHAAECFEMEQTCQLSEGNGHSHIDECYGTRITCGKAEFDGHSHTDSCYEMTLKCTLQETQGHVHGDGCYDETGTLTCQIVEQEAHFHSEGCSIPELVCGQAEAEAHYHDDSCHTTGIICGQEEYPAHTHGPECVCQITVCGKQEAPAHIHGEGCYEKQKALICGLTEIVAEEPELVLVCTLPLAQTHVHSDACMETTEENSLTCGLAEDETHIHGDTCYGSWDLACMLEEHMHSSQCFSDPDADVETAEAWERTFADVELTGVWAEDVIAIAETQLGYTESTRNYVVWEDGTVHGYTRYGDWYGSPHGDWCAMFVSFCLHYADVKDVPLNWGCRTWIEELSKEELDLYQVAEEYTPKPGDIVFFDWEDDGLSDHVGLVAELIPATEDKPAQVKTIEGNSSNQVKYNIYDMDDPQLLGYGEMPENPELEEEPATEETVSAETEALPYTFSDDTVYVEVVLPEGTSVPEDAVLTVKAIASDDTGYEALAQEAEAAVDGVVTNIVLYDISFYTADGNYIPVDDTAKVTMGFVNSPVDLDADVQLLHFKEEEEAPQQIPEFSLEEKPLEMILMDVQQAPAPTAQILEQQSQISRFTGAELSEAPVLESDLQAQPFGLLKTEDTAQEEQSVEETLETTSVEEQPEEIQEVPSVETVTEPRTVIEFTTDGFSVFAVVEVQTGGYVTQLSSILTGDQINDLDGLTLMLSSQANANNNITTNAVTHTVRNVQDGDNNYDQLVAFAVTTDEASGTVTANTNDLSNMLWTFEAVAGDPANDYYIKAVGTNQYLNLNNNASATLGNQQALYVVRDGNNNDVFIQTLPDGNDGRRRLSLHAGEDTFASYNQAPAYSDHIFLSIPAVGTTILADNAVKGDNHPLNGKTIAISTRGQFANIHRGLTAGGIMIGEDQQLKAINVWHNGNGITVGSEMLWEFIAIANEPDTYYIRSTATGGYLRIHNNSARLTVDATNADDGCKIKVVTGGGNGAVVLQRANGTGRYLSYNQDSDTFTAYTTPNVGEVKRADVYLSEFGDAAAAEQYVTNLDGQTLAIVSPRATDAVSSDSTTTNKNTAALGAVEVEWITQYETINVPDNQKDKVYWTFTAVDAANGVYNISTTVNGETKYLNIGNETATLGDAQNITVISKMIGEVQYIALRNGAYYLNDFGNDANSFAGYTEGFSDGGSCFILAQDLDTDALIGPENDNYDGTVTPDNHVIRTVPATAATGVKVSIFNYDKTVNTDAVSGGLANEQAFNEAVTRVLTDGKIENQDEVNDLTKSVGFRFFQQAPGDGNGNDNDTYHDYYMRKYGSENNFINSFLLGGSAYDFTNNYAKGYVYGEEQDVPFAANEVIFDNKALTAEKADALSKNGAEDGPGPFWVWNVGNGGLDDQGISILGIQNSMSVTLSADGYPRIYNAADGSYSSLGYLFNDNNGYHKGVMQNGGGLFQVDEEGYYYYHSELNAAYYDDTQNQFVLYDHIVRPNYTSGTEGDADRGNFLPFDSLGTVNTDGTVNWWTKDGNNNNDLDPDSFVDVNYANEYDAWKQDPDKTEDDEHFYSPVIEGADEDGKNICSAALADTNLTDNWFGMMIEIPFYMPENGQVRTPSGELEDMIFSFSGDDDVFVYVDDVLMINLSGIHGAQSGSINFTKGEFDHRGGYAIPDNPEGTNDNRSFAERFAAAGKTVALNAKGTFEDYSFHTLKFFYMERGGNISHSAIRFNMPTLPENSLQVRKEFLSENATDTEFTFRVVKAATGDDGKMLLDDDNKPYASDDLFVTPGTQYYVTKNGQVVAGKEKLTVATNGTFKLKDGEAAVFENILSSTTGDIPNIFVQEVLGPGVSYNVQYRLSGSTSTTGTPPAIAGPSDATQTIWQTQAIDPKKGSEIAVFYNSPADTAQLAITKKLAANVNAGENEIFNIRVKFNETLLPVGTKYHLFDTAGVELTDKEYRIEQPGIIPLKAGQTAKIYSITPGLKYEIAEYFTEGQNFNPGYNPTYTGTITPMARGNAGVSGSFVQNAVVQIDITNAKYPTSTLIPISKLIEDEYEESENFFFNVEQGTWDADTKTWTPAENGGRPGSLIRPTNSSAAGQTGNGTVIIGFPEDVADDTYYFKITEEAGTGNYIYDDTVYIVAVTKTGTTASVTNVWKDGENIAVPTNENRLAFVNRKTTSVTITKTVTGGNTTDTFNFTASATEADGTTPIALGTNANFTLKHNQSKTISGLPIGAIVTVTEDDETDYRESFTMSATYEAEYGTGGTHKTGDGASGNAWVGDLGYGTYLNIPVHVNAATGIDVWVCAATDAQRSFIFNGDPTITVPDTSADNSWTTWKYISDSHAALSLNEGVNTIRIGNETGNWAPNLDYIKVVFGRVTSNVAKINLLGDDAQITFQNEPLVPVYVEKTLKTKVTNASKTFTFSYTAYEADGETVYGQANQIITVSAGGKYGPIYIPTGGKIVVAESEASSAGYSTSYEVYSRYEAENAALSGTTADNRSGASGGKAVNGVGGGNSVTFTVNSQSGGPALMEVYYDTAEERNFQVKLNGTAQDDLVCAANEDWNTWPCPTPAERNVTLAAGANKIWLGNDGGAAPNLDYIDIVWQAETAGTSASMTEIKDPVTFHFINTEGYELPETGGAGTYLYTMGGLMLTLAAAILLYIHIKRGKEELASS